MLDLSQSITLGTTSPAIMLPIAVLLGSLHALEPGHAKSMIAAFIIATRGSVPQAFLLGLSAAIGHSIVVWVLALLGLWLGKEVITATAEPWLLIINGLLILLLAARVAGMFTHHHGPSCQHHTHAAPPTSTASPLTIIGFGLSGGLMPCPSAIAVLLVCLYLKKLTLGAAMVGAFSLGLALTLVIVGVVTALGHRALRQRVSTRLHRLDHLIPRLSAALMAIMGCLLLWHGVRALQAL